MIAVHIVIGLFLISLVFAAQQQLALVQRSSPPSSAPDLSTKDYDLLDIILVASVDGKFHALNRTSGSTLWSMSSFATTTSVSAPSSLAPLVRTQHVEHNADTDDDDNDTPQETYIIEPQSGDIYVMSTPSSPLQRFPFSMSELVEISPFTSTNEHETRYFVGRKETTLILMELETGKIKATLNSECPFIPDDFEDSQDVDLDELEGLISAPTEIYIGRTDYHISIHKKPTPGVPNPPIHNLSFSTYGPNNRDNHLQTLYRKTNDNAYVQSLPNGEIIAFRGRTSGTNERKSKGKDGPNSPLWGHRFNAPIVAIFDILQAPPTIDNPSPHPFVLLQPRPRLPDLFPSRSLSHHHLPNLEAAYVGLIEETGSLFAMSPEGFPLVVFGGNEYKDRTTATKDRKRLPGGEGEKKEPHEDVVDPHDSMCLSNPYDLRCMVGVKQVEDGDGPEGRLKRLLDGPPAPRASPMKGSEPISTVPVPVVGVGRTPEDDNDDKWWYNENTSGNSNTNKPDNLLTISDGRSNILSRLTQGGKLEALLFTILFGICSTWFLWRRVGMKTNSKVNVGGKERERTVIEDHRPENPVKHPERDHENTLINDTSPPVSIGQNTSLDNETTVQHPPPPVIMNGHADPINDITNTVLSPLSTPDVNLNFKHEFSIPLPPNPSPNPPLPISQTPTPPLPQTPLPSTPAAAGAVPGVTDDNEDSDAEAEVDNGVGTTTTPGKRKARRGKRGKKKKPSVLGGEEVGGSGSGEKDRTEKEKADKDPEGGEKPSSLILMTSSPKPSPTPTPSLIVSDTILGYGSHGTVVYQGSFQGRAVAVKRLLQDFVTLATREVSILQQSDDHPNVIRYYYQESHLNFFYIVLELCPASLADIIENPHGHGSGNGREEEWKEIVRGFDVKRAMKQVASGLRHLHGLGLVHRDIKPQNILISSSSSPGGRGGTGYRMLISDFGLCKKLDVDQTSFLPTVNGAMAAGTVGWRAPEILRGEVKLDDISTGDDSMSSRGSVATVNGASSSSNSNGTATTTKTRLTKSVDVFALGCLFYYTLTNGGHPYGDRFERDVNIIKDNKQLSLLSQFCSTEESTEAYDLITLMLHPQPTQRPDTKTCLLHPFFWDSAKRLGFLQDASDRFEVMCREPKDGVLIRLEKDSGVVVGNDWHQRLDKIFIENLGKYRKYDGKSVQDLMRALRNKKHHYQDLPDNVKRHLGPMPEGFLGYFTRRYPRLFMHVHGVVKDTGLHSEPMFRTYFELPEP